MTGLFNKELGRRIRSFREHRQLSIGELASIAHVPWAVLEDIENGLHFPNMGQIERLLLALDTTWPKLTAGFLDRANNRPIPIRLPHRPE